MSDQCKFISKLSGSRILILGGSSGIGYAAAECLLEHDAAAIIISSSNPSKVAEKVSSLQKSYPSKASRVSGHACNVGDQASLEGNLKALLDAATDNSSKKLDHVIHTAGDPLKPLPIETIDMPTLVQAGMVRFFSAIMLCKLAPNYMSEGPRASITLTTGSIGERPRKGWSAPVGYSSGLHGVMRGAALDLAPLRVNLIRYVRPYFDDANCGQDILGRELPSHLCGRW